jgi:hypothetical protein
MSTPVVRYGRWTSLRTTRLAAFVAASSAQIGQDTIPRRAIAKLARRLGDQGGIAVTDSVWGGLLWFTLSLINAGIAQGKGRSGLIWWLWSLLLGPLATLLVVIRPRTDS